MRPSSRSAALASPSAARRRSAPVVAGAMLLLALGGCSRDNRIDVTSGVGITATRTACPATAVPLHTGDVTLFDPETSRDARAIDVVATITNLRPACNEAGETVQATVDFDVVATRRDAGPARQVVLPYFATVVQGGSAVVAKRVANVVVTFPEGQLRGTGRGQGSASVDRAAATLPADIRERITRRRKAGDADAAIDPLSEPDVRAAVLRASFELLVGFQLTPQQLEYNVRR